jgi:DtxR family Mn-dependent transcriptional regulator
MAPPEPEPSWLAVLPELADRPAAGAVTADETMADVMRDADGSVRATVTRITEQLQSDMVLMLKLKRAGIQPGREVLLGAVEGGVRVRGEDGTDPMAPADLTDEIASHVFVSRE